MVKNRATVAMSGEDGFDGKEERVMKLAFLIVIGVLGVTIPLLWLTGTLTSLIYFCRHGFGTIRRERTVAFDRQLGLTMADGGDSIDEKKKE